MGYMWSLGSWLVGLLMACNYLRLIRDYLRLIGYYLRLVLGKLRLAANYLGLV